MCVCVCVYMCMHTTSLYVTHKTHAHRTFFDKLAKLNSALVHPDVPRGEQAGDTLG